MIIAGYAMDFTEVEPGWGQRPDGTMLFPSKEAAEDFAVVYRKQEAERLKTSTVPDYSYPGTPRLVEITKEQADRLASEGHYWMS